MKSCKMKWVKSKTVVVLFNWLIYFFFQTERRKAVPQLQFFFVCASVAYMWRLFCHYLFHISPSFGAVRRLHHFVFVFPGYLQLYF